MSNEHIKTGIVGSTLDACVEAAERLSEIRKADLHPGDWVLVKTVQSVYMIRVLGNGTYEVSGGWFDRKGLSPARLTIAGCTWGGSVIKMNVVAACGLSLEFGNRVITSAIRRAFVIPKGCLN
jgi:hypothetical protein